uniref:AAA+ ATPase domain-containing protein n=1 Tax=Odontella aurita TaxID=265563 RepID=A0A7S4JN38_9STRA|mmetsp:Transcript_50123/g.150878  ORF Transcript_50123/g.150878 Transcript_50123/m.150878 type:complete len:535 (+) Transcript_50123:65-1669(+)
MAGTSSNPKAERADESGDSSRILLQLAVSVLELGVVVAGSYFLSGWLANKIQQGKEGRPTNEEARKRLEKLLLERAEREVAENDLDEEEASAKRTQVQRVVTCALDLNEYETAIAEDVVDPGDITTAFSDVGGIDGIKAELWDLVVLPLLRPDLFRSDSGLVTPPRGILLYGAPGTGKTMLAKAIAKESGATFVNVRLSSIMDKWFGESNKLVSATFSLARKLAPSVVFIDEIDTFLNQRDSSEGSATSTMKSEFLTLWDGMMTDSARDADRPVIVLGATNRPYDVDSAILRRLPRTFEIGLPNFDSRLQILELFLKKQKMTEKARNMIPSVAKCTEGYSGSDLKELCRCAAMEPIREMTRESSRRAVMGHKEPIPEEEEKEDVHMGKVDIDPYYVGDQNMSVAERNMQHKIQNSLGKGGGKKRSRKMSVGPPKGTKVRPLDEKDFASALRKVKRTGQAARSFLRRESSMGVPSTRAPPQSHQSIDMNEVARGVQMLQMMMASQGQRQDGNRQDVSAEEGGDTFEETLEDIPSI